MPRWVEGPGQSYKFRAQEGFGVRVWAGAALVGADQTQNGGGIKSWVQLRSVHMFGSLSRKWEAISDRLLEGQA